MFRLLSLSCIIHESPGGAGGGAGTMEGGIVSEGHLPPAITQHSPELAYLIII